MFNTFQGKKSQKFVEFEEQFRIPQRAQTPS